MSGTNLPKGSFLALALFTVVTRLPLIFYPHALDDEGVYSLVANTILEGGRPYRDAIERKPPLLFWTYAFIFRVGGLFNWLLLHLVAVVWILLTMAGLYVLARREGGPRAGFLAAFFYAVYQAWGTWINLAFNGEVLMNLPIVWAMVLVMTPACSQAALLTAGALVAAGFLLKQPAAIAIVPLLWYLWEPHVRAARGKRWQGALGDSAVLLSGAAAVLVAASASLHAKGILREAVYWTVLNHDLPHVFWQEAVLHTLAFALALWPLVVGAAIVRNAVDTSVHRTWLVWLAVSAIGAAAGGRFYGHYYIQIVPPLAVMAAPVYARLWQQNSSQPRLARATAGWVALGIAAFFVIHIAGLYSHPSRDEAADYVRQHSPTDARIFVWGQAPAIYLDAERRPATRYITTFPLTGYIFGPQLPDVDTSARIVPGAWDHLDDDLRAHPPTFVVDTEFQPDARYPISHFAMLADYVSEHYQLAARTANGIVYERR